MLKQPSRITFCFIALAIPVTLTCNPGHSNDAPRGKYEHHVSVRFNGEHACSGSIYNERHILTSSSCIMETPLEDITVVAGTNSLSSGGDSYKIVKTITPESIFDDIALLRTQKPIAFRRGVRKIEFANYNDYDNDYRVKVIGWELPLPGETRENDMLQDYSLRLYDKDTCKRKNAWLYDKFICIFDPAGQTLCNTDGGGAIIADGLQIGIFLNKGSCYDAKDPLPHTPVYEYLNWIKTNSDVRQDNAKDLTVVAGINLLNEKGRVLRVQQIVPTYNNDYDIAILRITGNIIFNNRVKSIPIETYNHDLNDIDEMKMTGWEQDNVGEHRNNRLQEISLQTYDREKCKSVILFLSEAYMCAIDISMKNICFIDYGGPIVANGVQVGLNPFGVWCENNNGPVLFLPLSRHITWIDRNSRI